jgi:hypothetical protein
VDAGVPDEVGSLVEHLPAVSAVERALALVDALVRPKLVGVLELLAAVAALVLLVALRARLVQRLLLFMFTAPCPTVSVVARRKIRSKRHFNQRRCFLGPVFAVFESLHVHISTLVECLFYVVC